MQQTNDNDKNNQDIGTLQEWITLATTHPRLTQTQELDLAIAKMAGRKEARNKLIESNLRLVVYIATHFQNRNVELADLIQVGCVALIKAVDAYDYKRSSAFSAFVSKSINRAIDLHIGRNTPIVTLPIRVYHDQRKIYSATKQLIEENHTLPTNQALADKLNIGIEKVNQIAEYQKLKPLSLDNTQFEYAAPASQEPEQLYETKELSAEIKDVLQSILTADEYNVLLYRIGLCGKDEPYTIEETAQHLHTSVAIVRKLHLKALDKLRQSPDVLDRLKPYWVG